MKHELIFVVNGSNATDIERQAKVVAVNFFQQLDVDLLDIDIVSRQTIIDFSGTPTHFQADVTVKRRIYD